MDMEQLLQFQDGKKISKKDMQNTKKAMELIVMWYDMRTFCITRSSCKSCPYNGTRICRSLSTDDVLSIAAETFRNYIDS